MKNRKILLASLLLSTSFAGLALAASHDIKQSSLLVFQPKISEECFEDDYCLWINTQSLPAGNYNLRVSYSIVSEGAIYSYEGPIALYGKDNILAWDFPSCLPIDKFSMAMDKISFNNGKPKPMSGCNFPELPTSPGDHTIKINGNENQGYSCELQ